MIRIPDEPNDDEEYEEGLPDANGAEEPKPRPGIPPIADADQS